MKQFSHSLGQKQNINLKKVACVGGFFCLMAYRHLTCHRGAQSALHQRLDADCKRAFNMADFKCHIDGKVFSIEE